MFKWNLGYFKGIRKEFPVPAMFLNAENLKEDMLFCGPAYKFFL